MDMLLQDMATLGVVPDATTFGTRLKIIAHSQLAGWEVIRETNKVLSDMKAAGVAPNATIYSLVLDIWVRVTDSKDLAQEALRLLQEARTAGVVPDLILYNSTLRSLAKGARHNPGVLGQAHELIADMKKGGVEPDLVTFNTLLNVITRSPTAAMHDARSVFQEMAAAGVEPDVISYNTFLAGHARLPHAEEDEGDMWELLMQLPGDMRARGVNPNVRTYSSLLSCISKLLASRPDALVQLRWVLDDMIVGKVAPDKHFLFQVSRLFAVLQKANPDKRVGRWFFEVLFKNAPSGFLDHYCVIKISQGLTSAGLLAEAEFMSYGRQTDHPASRTR